MSKKQLLKQSLYLSSLILRNHEEVLVPVLSSVFTQFSWLSRLKQSTMCTLMNTVVMCVMSSLCRFELSYHKVCYQLNPHHLTFTTRFESGKHSEKTIQPIQICRGPLNKHVDNNTWLAGGVVYLKCYIIMWSCAQGHRFAFRSEQLICIWIILLCIFLFHNTLIVV